MRPSIVKEASIVKQPLKISSSAPKEPLAKPNPQPKKAPEAVKAVS